MTKEEFNAFVDDHDLDINSTLVVFLKNGETEKVTLNRKYAYDVPDRQSYPDKNLVKGQPLQILVMDLSSPHGNKGIMLSEVTRVETTD